MDPERNAVVSEVLSKKIISSATRASRLPGLVALTHRRSLGG
jgi:hypothetical protein